MMMMIASDIGSPIDRSKINARPVPPVAVAGQTFWEFEGSTEIVTSTLLTWLPGCILLVSRSFCLHN